LWLRELISLAIQRATAHEPTAQGKTAGVRRGGRLVVGASVLG
jgi:hypothetical protein